jgi:hypothetical protein
VKRFAHPSYSPDISPSDVCLFGKVKSALIGQGILNRIDLLETAIEILNGISDAELQHSIEIGSNILKRWLTQKGIV